MELPNSSGRMVSKSVHLQSVQRISLQWPCDVFAVLTATIVSPGLAGLRRSAIARPLAKPIESL